MNDRDYYGILGLLPGADGAMVDQTYWHLARRYQGLAETDPRARAKLDELNEAYGVLGTPRLREQYDAFRADRTSGRRSRRRRQEAGPSRSFAARLRSMLRPQPPLAAERTSEAATSPVATPSRSAQPAGRNAVATRAGAGSGGDLQSSTAALIERWRHSVAVDGDEARKPDMTLVDIFQSEHAVAEPDEPLFAAIDVLRGSKQPVELK